MPEEYAVFFQLFNQQKYFEAHEVLEALWRKDDGESRHFYQGLIQIAAVFVHLQRGNKEGAFILFQKARKHLEGYPPFYMGLSLSNLLRDVPDSIEQCVSGYKIEVTL